MKSLIKSALRSLGVEVRRAGSSGNAPRPGSEQRPIGCTRLFLEDMSARGFEPRGIIDVGANRGDWSRMAAEIFSSSPIIMIEPQVEMESRLSDLCRSRKNTQYIRAGAGAKEGLLVQTIWKDLNGSSFLPEEDVGKMKAGEQRKTKIVTLDGVLKGASGGFQPDLVKLDIQGFEIEALKGGENLFGSTELFLVETSLFPFMKGMPTASEVIQFMTERNYEIYDVTEFLRRPHDGALGQIDFAFVKAAGRFRQSAAW